MSLYLDQKYTGLLSPKLPLFKKKRENLYVFRCPVCGDSAKKKLRVRGYLYAKKNSLFFKCHNCGTSATFYKFLQQMDPYLAKEYALERFRNGENGSSNYTKPDIGAKYKTVQRVKREHVEYPCTQIKHLPLEHYARKYVENRLIPKKFFGALYFTPDFEKLVDALLPDHGMQIPNDPRLVIPFCDKQKKMIALQGRSLLDNDMRYITIKLEKDAPKVWGMDKVDFEKPIYVLEGPLDAMFLDNAIAAGGSDLPTNINPRNCVFIFDNEPHNKEIKKKMNRIVESGFNIFIWPINMKGYVKDVNDLAKTGLKNLQSFVEDRTYSGLKAKLEYSKWGK